MGRLLVPSRFDPSADILLDLIAANALLNFGFVTQTHSFAPTAKEDEGARAYDEQTDKRLE